MWHFGLHFVYADDIISDSREGLQKHLIAVEAFCRERCFTMRSAAEVRLSLLVL